MSLAEEITELEREIKMRETVYPDWCRKGKLTKQQAQHRTDCLKSTLTRLRALDAAQNGQQASLF